METWCGCGRGGEGVVCMREARMAGRGGCEVYPFCHLQLFIIFFHKLWVVWVLIAATNDNRTAIATMVSTQRPHSLSSTALPPSNNNRSKQASKQTLTYTISGMSMSPQSNASSARCRSHHFSVQGAHSVGTAMPRMVKPRTYQPQDVNRRAQ